MLDIVIYVAGALVLPLIVNVVWEIVKPLVKRFLGRDRIGLQPMLVETSVDGAVHLRTEAGERTISSLGGRSSRNPLEWVAQAYLLAIVTLLALLVGILIGRSVK